MKKNVLYTTLGIGVVVLVSVGLWLSKRPAAPVAMISSYDECVSAGYAVITTDPPTCTTADGVVFIGPISNTSGAPATSTPELAKTITTAQGTLTLSYDNGRAVLAGALNRSTPCVDYQVAVMMATSTDQIDFNIADSKKGVICIQSLGTPQAISANADAAKSTRYVIRLETTVVFSGHLTGSSSAAFAKENLLAFADEPVDFVTHAAISTKYLVDHRTSFDGEAVTISGVVVGLGHEKTCLIESRGCTQDQIILNIRTNDRNALYDLPVVVDHSLSTNEYRVGDWISVKGLVFSSAGAVYLYQGVEAPASSRVARAPSSPILTLVAP